MNGTQPSYEEKDYKFEKIRTNIVDFLKIFDDGDKDLKTLFGDHVSVTITPKGAYVEHYDHD